MSANNNSSFNRLSKKPSIQMLNADDLELDDDDEIVIPYEILNPNESIAPLTHHLQHHLSPTNRSRSNTLNSTSISSTPRSIDKKHTEIPEGGGTTAPVAGEKVLGDDGIMSPSSSAAAVAAVLVEEDFDILPIESFRNEILTTIHQNQIMILIGETGSGKTTQIPQFLLNTEYLTSDMKTSSTLRSSRKMAVTQPRRIAAISVAKRVSEEVGCALGETVGYIVRFDDVTDSEKTKIKFMTDGILIRECLSDPLLLQYSVIMLDEAHERSLNTDILFGLLKTICLQRKDLKLIITSATLDANKFSNYFFSCPILSIPGRNYPVDIYHSKTKQIMTINGPANTSYIQSAVDVVLKIHTREEEGHILVFLTGQEEIEKACLLLRQTIQQWKSEGNHHNNTNTNDDEKGQGMNDRELIILPLYAALTNEEQIKIFQKPALLFQSNSSSSAAAGAGWTIRNRNHFQTTQPANSNNTNLPRILRKCVIATNIAETSITVPHVRFVVDAGYVKQKVYDPSRGMESLVVVPISKIAAQQRAGRAGRTGPGQCYRLYSSECFDNMMDETIPEIQRTNLANTILYLKAIGINNVLEFDFLDQPSQDQVLQALTQLFMLKAIAENGEITALGRKMSNFPLDPCLSRMLIESATRELHCLEDMVILCSMLCVENVFYKPKLRKSQIAGSAKSNVNNLFKYGPNGGKQAPMNKNTPLTSTKTDAEKDRFLRQLSVEEERIEIAHAGLRSEFGDFITLWNIFLQWEKFHFTYEWCERNYINYRSMKTARKIRDHLSQDTKKFKLYESTDQLFSSQAKKEEKKGKEKENRDEKEEATLEKRLAHAITSGYFMNAAMQCTNDSVYKCLTLPSIAANRSSKPITTNPDLRLVYISPQSAFSYTSPPEYVIYQELIFNNKLYMRNINYVSKKRLFSFINDWKPVASVLQLSGIVEGKEVGSDGGNEKSRSKRERENDTKGLRIEDSVAKREKREYSEEYGSGSSNSQTANSVGAAVAASAVDQARLRYLMRKKASS